MDNPNLGGTVTGRMGRVTHDVTGHAKTYDPTSGLPRWNIVCMLCHGGDSLGGLHGSNARKGRSSSNSVIGGSYRGKRLLNGATWAGVTRASTSSPVQCWLKAGAGFGASDTVNACWKDHAPQDGRTANYNYESGPDP